MGRKTTGARAGHDEQESDHRRLPMYALVAFAGFLILLAVYVGFLRNLVQLGQDDRLYYLVLMPMGLCAATVLIGILRGQAKLTGRIGRAKWEFVGAPAVFFAILGAGWWMQPDKAFTQVVYVQIGATDADARRQALATGGVRLTCELPDGVSTTTL